MTAQALDTRSRGTIVGLNDAENFTRGLGIWAGFDPKRNEISISTPLSALTGVSYLYLGHITLTDAH